jgi:hypothetical protein
VSEAETRRGGRLLFVHDNDDDHHHGRQSNYTVTVTVVTVRIISDCFLSRYPNEVVAHCHCQGSRDHGDLLPHSLVSLITSRLSIFSCRRSTIEESGLRFVTVRKVVWHLRPKRDGPSRRQQKCGPHVKGTDDHGSSPHRRTDVGHLKHC